MMIEEIGLRALRQLDPERAHGLALRVLRLGITPAPGAITSDRLRTTIAGLELPNPIGLAAGFDKNAEVIPPLMKAGFGFLEVGAATPRPQPGNPKPRLFRLSEDQAAINRFGFNNDGASRIAERLRDRPKSIPLGLNLGANKDSQDKSRDFASVLSTCGAFVDFATVNVSSPNTEKLRDLQGSDALAALLENVAQANAKLENPIPIFLKIAPDLTDAEIADVARVAVASEIDAIIATNTTLSRAGLRSKHSQEVGGLSGQPLFEHSTRVLAKLSHHLDGAIPLIGVGGIGSAADAYAKIKAGASAVQLYTAMVYKGLSLSAKIADGLDEMLKADGIRTVANAVGIERERWL